MSGIDVFVEVFIKEIIDQSKGELDRRFTYGPT